MTATCDANTRTRPVKSLSKKSDRISILCKICRRTKHFITFHTITSHHFVRPIWQLNSIRRSSFLLKSQSQSLLISNPPLNSFHSFLHWTSKTHNFFDKSESSKRNGKVLPAVGAVRCKELTNPEEYRSL